MTIPAPPLAAAAAAACSAAGLLAASTSVGLPGVDASQLVAVGVAQSVIVGSVAAALAWNARRAMSPSTTAVPTPVAGGIIPGVLARVDRAADGGASQTGADERLQFDARLERALDSARNEEDLYAIVGRAAESIPPLRPTELLLVGDHEKTIVQVLEVGAEGEGPGCPVTEPGQCEAIRAGRTQTYDHSDAIDACAHLRDRITGPCSAVCVPVRVLGRSIGVLHRTGHVGKSPSAHEVGYAESIGNKVGVRLSLIRSAEKPNQMSIDPVTGLLDRPSIENRVLSLARELVPFSLAQCDMDHFQDFTRAYGTSEADRALRVLAAVLTEILRPGDHIGRFGDDELLIVLPNASNGDAQRALERAREHLTLTLSQIDIPPFTCSFGVVESSFGAGLEDLLVAADIAVSLAKDMGRNRVVVAGAELIDPLVDED